MDRSKRFLALLFLCFIPTVRAEVQQADRVVILKAERKLVLYSKGQIIKRYRVALGPSPSGPKMRQGTIELRKALTPSTLETRAASFISRCISRIRTRLIATVPGS